MRSWLLVYCDACMNGVAKLALGYEGFCLDKIATMQENEELSRQVQDARLNRAKQDPSAQLFLPFESFASPFATQTLFFNSPSLPRSTPSYIFPTSPSLLSTAPLTSLTLLILHSPSTLCSVNAFVPQPPRHPPSTPCFPPIPSVAGPFDRS